MRYLILLYVSLIWLSCAGQYINNGDFEGPTGLGNVPSGWSGCHPLSTPDTQPGVNNTIKAPSLGKSYLGLIARGDAGPYANTTEDITTSLLVPLKKDSCYYIQIDLSISEHNGHEYNWDDWLSYYNPVILNFYAGSSTCDTIQFLWASPPIVNLNWETFYIPFVPDSNITSITMAVKYAIKDTTYFGNVCVDNLRLGTILTTTVWDTIVDYNTALNISIPSDISSANYIWISGEDIPCETCSSNNPTILNSFQYMLIVTDSMGCTANYEYNVEMSPFFPNVFTPNADGINDYFEVLGVTVGGNLTIYNRWGALIYSTDVNPVWAGRNFSGILVPAGTYYFSYKGDDADVKNGYIQLIR